MRLHEGPEGHCYAHVHAAAEPLSPGGDRRYAVIGGGIAGVATAFHLMRTASCDSPVQLELYDAVGEAVILECDWLRWPSYTGQACNNHGIGPLHVTHALG